ncbi:MAG: DegV family protein, partial [Clostridia bacterium]|nr:DegV family protein [Clostridia bacterium]
MLSIVTDSAAALPPDMPADLPIRVVPFTISLGEETFLDGVDIKPVEFYARLRTGGPFPMTSQPSPGAYLTVFQELLSSGPVLCLTLSSALSGSFESARQAKAHLGDPPGLAVVDTGTAAACQGVLALIAARAASRGETLAAVLARVEDLRDRVEMLGVLADLHYLARG